MNKALLTFLVCLSPFNVWAALQSMVDSELGSIDGAGVAFVLEDFFYISGDVGHPSESDSVIEFGGIKSSNGDDVTINVTSMLIVDGLYEPVNIGRLKYPITLGVLDGDDPDVGIAGKSVFQIAMPYKGTTNPASVVDGDLCLSGHSSFGYCSSRIGKERISIGYTSTLNIAGQAVQHSSVGIGNLVMDGSRIRFWGEGDDKLTFDLQLNMYAETISISDYTGSGQATALTDVAVELALGYGSKQPVTFEVLDNGHFKFEVASLEGKCASYSSDGGCQGSVGIDFFNDFYSNGPKGNVFIGNMSLGGTNLGTSTIENLQIQYLEVTSHDL